MRVRVVRWAAVGVLALAAASAGSVQPHAAGPIAQATPSAATSSPPPPYDFDHMPEIRSERPVFDVRHGNATHGAAAPVAEH